MNQLLTRVQVEELTQFSRTTIYRLMRDGCFPCPRRIGKKAVRWDAAELQEWLESRPLAEGEHKAA